MIRKILAFIIVPCVLMMPAYVFAAQKPLPAQADSTAAFKMKQAKVEDKLKKIESLVERIAKGKRVLKGDGEELDRLMIENANDVNDAVKQAIADAEEAKNSKGQKGSVRSFVEFENMAKNGEKRAKVVHAKVKNIEKQIKTGDVELDRSLLESMTPAERKEYMQYMTPSGREKMKKKNPKLLSGISVETNTNLVYLENIGKSGYELCRSTARTMYEFLGSIPETAGNFLVPPAEAAIGASAGAACAATGPAVVITCPLAVIAAAVGYARALDDLKKCLAGQCGCAWYKPWCCAGKTGCWVIYYATCA